LTSVNLLNFELFFGDLNSWPSVVVLKHVRTSKSFLLQKHVFSLDGPVLTASGFKEKLAVVTHAFDCLSSNDQVGSVLRFYLVFIF